MKHDCIDSLCKAGISFEDATALRRISMTLHRWHELECGNSNEYVSTVISRGRKVNGAFEHDDNGKPFLQCRDNKDGRVTFFPLADKERGALKRLAAIVARYPGFAFYVQGDPRGASLYILRPGAVPPGASVESYYSNGIAVYK